MAFPRAHGIECMDAATGIVSDSNAAGSSAAAITEFEDTEVGQR